MSLKIDSKTQEQVLPVFGAFCFFLSAIEFLIPKPLPFMRIGFANVPIMLAVSIFNTATFFKLVIIKIIGQGIITGTLFSYTMLLSIAGSFSAALVMYSLRRVPARVLSFIGMSLLGAAASNLAQLAMARLLLFGNAVAYVAVPLLTIGCISGLLLGVFSNAFAQNSKWYKQVRSGQYKPIIQDEQTEASTITGRFIIGLILLVTMLVFSLLAVRLALFVFLLIACKRDKIRIRVTLLIITMTVITVFNLYPPFGKHLFSIGKFPITTGALEADVQKALLFECLLYCSRWMLHKPIRIPTKLGATIQQALTIFQKLNQQRARFNPKEAISALDEILLSAGSSTA